MNKTLLLLTFTVLTSFAYGDQLAYLSKSEAIRAAETLRSRELVVTYCSECDESSIVFWLVSHVEARYTEHQDFYQVHLTGWPILESKRELKNYEHPSQLDYVWPGPSKRTLQSIPLDLAYTYLLSDDWWLCAGQFLALDCEVRVPRFRL